MTVMIKNTKEKYPEYIAYDFMAKAYHTNDFKEKARKALGVPDYPQVDAIYGAPWYWEGAGMYLTPISFYHNGELVARADFDIETRENAKSILMYNGK